MSPSWYHLQRDSEALVRERLAAVQRGQLAREAVGGRPSRGTLAEALRTMAGFLGLLPRSTATARLVPPSLG